MTPKPVAAQQVTSPTSAPANPSPTDALETRRRVARAACTRWLPGHGDISPRAWLQSITDAVDAEELDMYGQHGEVALLETEVAQLLGKQSAVFLVSGTMAQQSVLRAWTERSTTRKVAVHGLSHIMLWEANALSELHGIRPQILTSDPRQPSSDDLAALSGPLAAATLELPLRDAGYVLPTWEELVDFASACRDRGVPLHLDGARLWESQPYYERPLAEITSLADTVYVSFYKGLGGLAGAAVAGPDDIIADVRVWQHRHGGRLFTMLPYAAAARHGLKTYLPTMPAYYRYAVELATACSALAGFRVFPDPPRTNAFRIFADVPVDAINGEVLRRMENEQVGASRWWHAADVPGWSWTEITVGSATLEWPMDEAVALLAAVRSNAAESAGFSPPISQAPAPAPAGTFRL